jgi:hypothetical protein
MSNHRPTVSITVTMIGGNEMQGTIARSSTGASVAVLILIGGVVI